MKTLIKISTLSKMKSTAAEMLLLASKWLNNKHSADFTSNGVILNGFGNAFSFYLSSRELHIWPPAPSCMRLTTTCSWDSTKLSASKYSPHMAFSFSYSLTNFLHDKYLNGQFGIQMLATETYISSMELSHSKSTKHPSHPFMNAYNNMINNVSQCPISSRWTH